MSYPLYPTRRQAQPENRQGSRLILGAKSAGAIPEPLPWAWNTIPRFEVNREASRPVVNGG
jgi:hypothetical protein